MVDTTVILLGVVMFTVIVISRVGAIILAQIGVRFRLWHKSQHSSDRPDANS